MDCMALHHCNKTIRRALRIYHTRVLREVKVHIDSITQMGNRMLTVEKKT